MAKVHKAAAATPEKVPGTTTAGAGSHPAFPATPPRLTDTDGYLIPIGNAPIDALSPSQKATLASYAGSNVTKVPVNDSPADHEFIQLALSPVGPIPAYSEAEKALESLCQATLVTHKTSPRSV